MGIRCESPAVSIFFRVAAMAVVLVVFQGCADPVPPVGPGAPQANQVDPGAPHAAPDTSSPALNTASSAVPSSPAPSPAPRPDSPDPFSENSASDGPAWSNQVTGNLPGGARRLVRIDHYNAPVVFSSMTPRFALVGQEIHDLVGGARTGKVSVELKSSLERVALSPDGKYLARQASPDNMFEIEIHDTVSGERLHSLTYSSKPFQRIEFLTFTRHGRLIAAVWEGNGSRLLIWDVTKQQPLRDLTMPRIDGKKVAISEDGRIMAAVLDQRLEIHDLAQNKKLTVLDPPPHDKPFNPMMFVTGLAFSPDAQELAGLFSLDGFRFVVWKTDGQVTVDQPLGLQIGGAYNHGDPIQWSPDGRGWILHGNFYFDRQLDMVAWILEPPVQHNYPHPWLSATEVIASVGDFQDRSLVAVPFPREALDRATGAIGSDAEAWLRPGDGVTLDIKVGTTRFADAGSVTQALREAITKRLTAGGLNVGEGQPVKLQLHYAESQGSELQVVAGGPGLRGQPTGQRVQETVVEVKATMTRTGKAGPIWTMERKQGNPHIVRGDTVDDQAVRAATFRAIEYTLNSMSIPSFIPAGSDVSGLPIITSLK